MIKKNNLKSNRGFTLIELLSVIIILGVLLIIAVPSITHYIEDSRKKSYIISARELIVATSNKINSGKLKAFDMDTTYYMPVSCLKMENEASSPFGKFSPAYVVFTYDGTGYDYYWTSTDEAEMGIIKITAEDELDVSNIKPGSKAEDINTDRTIDGRSKIAVFGPDCESSTEKEAVIYGLNSKTCKYDGELVQGAEFVDGQYTYRYMQEASGSNSWRNISDDGWGVALTNKNSTDPVTTELCTDINGKRIVSMANMFYYSKAPSIDTHTFDTGSVTNMSYMFYGMSSLTSLTIDNFYTKNVNNMAYMFGYDTKLETIKVGKGFDTTNVTNMNGMFYYNSMLKNVDFLENFNTSNVTSMSSMFYNCSSISDVDGLRNWDVSKVTNMSSMFYYCSKLTNINGLKNWNVSNVTNMSSMFYYCSKLTNISGLKDWNVSNVRYLDKIFYYAYNLGDLGPLANWNVTNVTSIQYPFYYIAASSIEPLRNWNLSSLTNYNYLFYYMRNVTDLSPILDWNISRINSMRYTFAGMSSLQNLNSIRNLDVSRVKDFTGLFSGCTGLTNITALTNWNMNNVETMDYMFQSTTKVTDYSSVKQWSIPKVKTMKYMFASNYQITSLSQFSNWNISNVQSIKGMFSNCTKLNDLTGLPTWTITSLTDMSSLFEGCSGLTNLEGIRYLNLRNVTNLSKMFFKCTNLTNISPLTNWDVSRVTNVGGMFGCEYISNPSATKNWNITNIAHPNNQKVYNVNGEPAGFYLMFKTTRRYYLTQFTKRNGCWAGDGTYVPNGTGSACNTNDNYSCGGGCLDGEMEVVVYDEEKKKKVLKKIKDITYNDLILVWNFDEGKFEWAKPLWIMEPVVYHESVVLSFDDGTILKVVGDHKIYNDDAKKFTSARFEEETPIGMHTINSEGKKIKLVGREIIRADVYAYNVITDKHINLYANGILTSRGSNNLYPIEEMKFIKEDRETFTREELKNIPDEYFYGLRLNERRIDYQGTKEETKEDIERLVNQLIKDKKNKL